MIQYGLMMLIGAFGALLTFFLQKQGLSSVLSSCLVGLLGVLVSYLTKYDAFMYVCFAGSFVGMTAISIGTYPIILASGAVCGLIFHTSKNLFVGYGGKMGTSAFISVAICFLIISIYQKLNVK